MDNEIKVGEIAINRLTLEVKWRDVRLELEPKWVQVLIALATEPNSTLTRDQIIKQVWEDYLVGEDSLNRAISQLRKALEPVPGLSIKTARGVGYELVYETLIQARKWQLSRVKKNPWLAIIMIAPLILISVFLIVRGGKSKAAILPQPYQTHITSDLGIEYSPDISPDNKFIAYTWNGGKGSQWNIYLKQIGLEGSQRFTDGPGSDQSASWSNGGDKIAFFQKKEKGWLLSVKTFLGTEERALLKVRSVWKTARGISWAPDDKSLVFSAIKYGSKVYSLNRIDLNDLSVTELKTEEGWDYTMPQYSPDHRLIASVAHRGIRLYQTDILDSIIGKLQVIEAATGKVVFEKLSKREISSMDWKSNNSLILTFSGCNTCSIYEINLEDDESQLIRFDELSPLLTISDAIRSMTYHGESNDLYLEKWRADVNIWRAKYDKGQILEKARFIGSTLFDYSPKLSPDESKIAYVSDKSNHFEVWLHDMKSGLSKQLTELRDYSSINSINWSHSGDQLVMAVQGGTDDGYVAIIDTLGREIKRLERAKGIHRPVWSKDDRLLYAILYDAQSKPAIWSYNIEEDEWSQYSKTPADYVKVIGDQVYYSKTDRGGLWRSNINSPDVEELVSSRLPKPRFEYWTIDGDTLKLISLDFEKSFLEIIHVPSQTLLSSTQINNYIPVREPGATFSSNNEFFFSSIDNYDADIVKIKLTGNLD